MKLPLLKRSAPSAAGGPSAAKKKRPSLKKLGKKKFLALVAAAALVIGLGGRTLLGGGAQAAKTSDGGYTTALVTRRDVTATAAGQVWSVDVEVGDEIQAGQTVATIRDSATMELKVPFPADDAASFSLGQSATVTLDGTTLNIQ